MPDQIAYGLAEREPMPVGMCLRHRQRIIFYLQRRSWHQDIILASLMLMMTKRIMAHEVMQRRLSPAVAFR